MLEEFPGVPEQGKIVGGCCDRLIHMISRELEGYIYIYHAYVTTGLMLVLHYFDQQSTQYSQLRIR